MKFSRIFLLTALLSSSLAARPIRSWTYADLDKESDLILICRVDSSTKRTGEKVTPSPNGPEYEKVITGFTIEAKMKGDYSFPYFQLSHLYYPAEQRVIVNGCTFCWFPKKDAYYLLFLKYVDGELQPTSGYCDSHLSTFEIPNPDLTERIKSIPAQEIKTPE